MSELRQVPSLGQGLLEGEADGAEREIGREGEYGGQDVWGVADGDARRRPLRARP